jgi:hypothetical protein
MRSQACHGFQLTYALRLTKSLRDPQPVPPCAEPKPLLLQWTGTREGTLVLIQRGDRHEIRNTGEGPLKTLNVYVPPAYTEDCGELPAGRA